MHHPLRILLAALLAALIAAPAGAESGKTLPRTRAEVQLSFAPLVKQAAPAVVNIYTRRLVRQSGRPSLLDDPFFRRFFNEDLPSGQPRERVQQSLGSGVILSAKGLIVTNNHVIEGAQEITVALSDRREFEAELVLADTRTDLAVLRIDAGVETLPFLKLRDSDELEVGDLVLAIGNPFGVGQTVTSGIVSALGRTAVGTAEAQAFIQTDAAINPGNSGGALITMDGRLAGINTAIYSRTGGSHGIGFATPANLVAPLLRSASGGGALVRPWLGADGQTVNADIAAAMGLDRPGGVLVSAVHPNGPAERAGLRVGDVVVSVDGKPIYDMPGLRFRIATRSIGDTAALEVRRGNAIRRLSLALQPAPEVPPRELTPLGGEQPLAGAIVGNLSPAFAEELQLPFDATGVIVAEVAPGSPAQRMRLRPGDRILSVNGVEISSVRQLLAALAAPAGSGWQIAIRRGEQTLNLVIRG